MTTKLVTLILCISGPLALCSQTSQQTHYVLDKKFFHTKGAEYVPTGSYKDASGKTISVQAFFMTNEVTNKEYKDFLDYVVTHPDSSIYYYEHKDGSNFIRQVPFSQIRSALIDSLAMAKKYPDGTDLYNKYKNYFSDKEFDDFPVVGVSYDAANYYCIWKTRLENETLKKSGMGLMNDFRLPLKEELEYAQSFSPAVSTESAAEVAKSKSGRPDKLGLYNLFSNVDELNVSLGAKQTSSGQVGFRMVSTFLGQ